MSLPVMRPPLVEESASQKASRVMGFMPPRPVSGDQPHDMCQVLTVGLFDGLGALRLACDALGLPMCGHISVESHAPARRVVESFFPGTVMWDDVRTVTEEVVLQWSTQLAQFSSAGVVLIGAGPPCQGSPSSTLTRRVLRKMHEAASLRRCPRLPR